MRFTGLTLLTLLMGGLAARAQTTVFSYQGRLNNNGAPANGEYDLQFTLRDSASGANVVGTPVAVAPVSVTNGLFTVALNFGSSVFDGSARWLDIGVRNFGDTNAYAVLGPRQSLTSTPYAIRAINAAAAAAAAALSIPLPATNMTGTVPDARLSTNVALLNTNANFAMTVGASNFVGRGLGLSNVPATGLSGTLPDARLSANVALLTGGANFAGTVSANYFAGNGTGLTNVPGRIFDTIPTGSAIQALANTGYLATNDATPVVVTLPATMRVGEIVRVSGSGAAGWTVAQNAGQSILVGNLLGNVGVSWTPRDSSRSWKAVAASADGSKLVAVVNVGQIYTSANYGSTWSSHEGNRNWQAVASSGDGAKLVAVVNNGQIYTSSDSGGSWTPRDSGRNWSAVASSLNGVNLVAAVNNGQLYTSVNSGASWTPREGVRNWISVASSANGSNLVAVVQGGQIFTSTTAGTAWTARDSNRSWIAVASSADGAKLVAAVGGEMIYTSLDFGVTWSPSGLINLLQWTAVTSSADGSRLAAVYNNGGLYVSTDAGRSWAQRGSVPNLSWTGVAASADGSTLVAVPSNGQIYVSSQPTTTVGTAGYLSGSRLAAVELQFVGNGQFLPISSIGTISAY